MSALSLRYAGVAYFDRTRPLELGEVVPEGIDLEFVGFDNVGELFRRMAQEADFEVSEMSLSTLCMMVSRGDDRLVGIPVFPSRAFRQSQIYVHAGAGIEKPQDLAGRRVGVPEYQMTAALWIRAVLEHDYGVPPSAVRWQTGGLKTPAYQERFHHDLPEGVTLERIPADKALEPMLAAGELDALIHAHQPDEFRAGNPAVARLFPDYRAVERDYYGRTGLFPIMHTVVVRRDVYDANPWIARSLLDAFEEAKRRARERLRDQDTLAVMHPWLAAELDCVKAEFGGDPFAYGLEANRKVLEATTQYSFEQGLSVRKLDPAELFAAETHGWTASEDEPRA